jgi:hypothetical protein
MSYSAPKAVHDTIYRVCDNANLRHFEQMCADLSSLGKRSGSWYRLVDYIDFVGYDHKTCTFELAHPDTIDITYVDQYDDAMCVIPIVTAKMRCIIELNVKHKYYKDYISSQWQNPIKTNIVRVNEQIYGVRLCDLIRHYVMINGPNNFCDSDDQCTIDPNTKRYNKKVIEIMNRIMRTDFSQINVVNSLGMYNQHDHIIRVWSALMKQKYINCNTNVFTDYFQKIVYFSSYTMNQLLYSKDVDGSRQYLPIHSKFTEMLNSLSSKEIITKIMRHYLYNEDPSINTIMDVYYFDTPKKIIDILSMIHELSHDTSYVYMRGQLMKKPNAKQQIALNEKYKDIVFDSIEQIPETYPFYALQNVYLSQWSILCGISELKSRQLEYMNVVTNPRTKHEYEISGKYVDSDDIYSSYSWHYPRINQRKNMKRYIVEEVRDYYYPIMDDDI